jgi:hypothetical protein
VKSAEVETMGDEYDVVGSSKTKQVKKEDKSKQIRRAQYKPEVKDDSELGSWKEEGSDNGRSEISLKGSRLGRKDLIRSRRNTFWSSEFSNANASKRCVSCLSVPDIL